MQNQTTRKKNVNIDKNKLRDTKELFCYEKLLLSKYCITL